MSDFIIENALQAVIWPLLKQIAVNRKLKNKSKGVDTLPQSARITPTKRTKRIETEETTKMTTLAQACKAVVKECISEECKMGQVVELMSIARCYSSEYGNYNGTSPKACKDYLQGLPSVCTVPFYNGEILELLAAQGISRKSEAAKDKLIEDYWLACGYQFWKLVK